MWTRITVLVVLASIAAAVSAGAQSFGRNKVRYRNPAFKILQTPHFDIYYYPAEHDATIEVGRLAERWHARLARALGHTFRSRQPIVLYASHSQFTQTNVISGFLGDGIGGVTEHQRGRIVLPLVSGLGETDHVLGHELVHAFQRDILRERGRSLSLLPLWFIEGMAEYLSIGRIDSNTAMWLRDAVQHEGLPTIEDLDGDRWFPYRFGQALWVYLADRFGEDIAERCLKSKAPGGAIGRIVDVTGVDAKTLSEGWHEFVRGLAFVSSASPGGAETATIIHGGSRSGRLNVGPSLSPDGRSIVFASERDHGSVGLFLADTATGAIRKKLVQTAGDPHFDSLQFIESTGAWDRAGRRFALAAVSRGEAVLTIFDIETGTVGREIKVADVDQLFSPTWSPDGRRLVFSALKGGTSDLYLMDLDTAPAVRPLTSDAFADLHPAWSPDGRTIAFSTDRFSTSLDTLTFGLFGLAALDVDSGNIRPLPGIPAAKSIDPHWSADGDSLYFVADGEGVSNVYRLSIATGELFQVTSETIGVSGVTALSPALSVATSTGRLAFSVYRGGAYEIHAIDHPSGTQIDGAAEPAPAASPESTQPRAQSPGRVLAGGAAMSTIGLPDGKAFSERAYRSGLSLDRTIQPYLSAGGGGTGGFLRAGVGLSFGDMLGDHRLDTAIQAGKSLDDFAVQVAYLNRQSRWNWGVGGGQIAWLTGFTQTPLDIQPASQSIGRQTDLYRQLHRHVSGVAIYPFSGATRVELSSGFQSISFDRHATTSLYSSSTGRLMSEETSTLSAGPSAILVATGVALINDTAVFGPTSPITGHRVRMAIAPTFGDIGFATVTADVRKYVKPISPFTVAMRGMFVGRLGGGATNPRLAPLAWTLRDVVRGYGDTGPSAASLGYLNASRMWVANLELRVPFGEVFGGKLRTGQVPIEGLVFSDVGRFALVTGGPAGAAMLRSVGTGARLQVAGFVFELDAVRPFDGSTRGWTLAFNVRPGF